MQDHGGFIPGIEGMRALAVLMVLLFHLDVPFLDGGYLGVDLFFVISGFIITRNILADQERDRFSLREFYVRRFRRLFPALLATVLLTLLVGTIVLPPAELVATAVSSIYAVFSLANIHFWLSSGYFEAAAESQPLLHTWSLSVEEQFYLFWPALLLVLANTRQRAVVIVILLAVPMIAGLMLRKEYPDAVFYLLPFRLPQLMAGALIAVLSMRLVGASGNLAVLLASAGLIALSSLSVESLSPATAAALVTGLGFLLLLGREAPFARVFYGHALLQWVGRRSYAIYLVHWPIIVLYNFAASFELDNWDRIALFFLSLAAAVLMHEWVEKPLRKRGEDTTRMQKLALPVIVLSLVLTLGIALTLWHLEGLQGRVDERLQRVVDSVKQEKRRKDKAIRYGKCNLHKQHVFADYDPEACATPHSEKPSVLLLGDSMAADTYMLLEQTYPEIHIMQATAAACTALLNLEAVGGRYAACEDLNTYRFSDLIDNRADAILLASVWTEDRIEPLRKTVEYLQSRGQRVLVFGPRTVFKASIPMLVSQHATPEAANAALREKAVVKNSLLEKMRAAMPDVTILDIGNLQCSPACEILEGDELLYYDQMHMTKLGAKRIGERMRQTFDLTKFVNSPKNEAR
jgi:peptidoglycan/LPS O-acetylase OafA/YrhL